MRLDQLATDLDLEEAGVWVPIEGDFECRIASASSKRAQNAYKKYLRPIARRIETGTISEDASAKAFAQYIAHGLLTDWRGAEDQDGKPLPYSIDIAVQVLARKDMKYLRHKLQEEAGNQAIYRAAQQEEDAEALKVVSNGSSKPASS